LVANAGATSLGGLPCAGCGVVPAPLWSGCRRVHQRRLLFFVAGGMAHHVPEQLVETGRYIEGISAVSQVVTQGVVCVMNCHRRVSRGYPNCGSCCCLLSEATTCHIRFVQKQNFIFKMSPNFCSGPASVGTHCPGCGYPEHFRDSLVW
jgi:hypothetical protein